MPGAILGKRNHVAPNKSSVCSHFSSLLVLSSCALVSSKWKKRERERETSDLAVPQTISHGGGLKSNRLLFRLFIIIISKKMVHDGSIKLPPEERKQPGKRWLFADCMMILLPLPLLSFSRSKSNSSTLERLMMLR